MKAVLSFAIGLSLSAAFLAAQIPPRNLTLAPIHVQRKLALIIGNQAYPKSPLRNPLNHAAAIAKAMRGMGFDEVIEKTDLTMRQMRVEIDRFSASLRSGDLALFYYAGHGVQADEKNYLIPVDFSGTSQADLPYDAFPAAQIRDKLEQSGARLRILILDACRNNPFRSKRDGVRGLSPMASYVEGTYIAYATADNGVADDNPTDGNGLFTQHLLLALSTPGLDLKQIFEKTKQDVYVASQKTQRPYTYDGVIGQFFFTGPVTVVVNPPAASSSDLAVQEEIASWNGVDKSDAGSLQLYLTRYPNGRFADFARRYLTKMEPSSTAVPPPPVSTGLPDAVSLQVGKVDGNKVYLSGGANAGVKVNDFYDVRRMMGTMKDRSGNDVDIDQRIETVVVLDVQDTFSVAKTTSGDPSAAKVRDRLKRAKAPSAPGKKGLLRSDRPWILAG